MGLMRICHTFLPKLALSGGNIINIGSIFTKSTIKNAPSYTATKSAVESLTKSMASCWAEHKVRVNCIAPGFIEGNTLNKILEEEENIIILKIGYHLKDLAYLRSCRSNNIFSFKKFFLYNRLNHLCRWRLFYRIRKFNLRKR